MSDQLRITLVQSNLVWENKTKNRAQFDKLLAKAKKTDVIILPEMFLTGFSMNAKPLAETMDGESVKWMKTKAKKLKAVICGSLIIKENKKNYNRFVWVMPNGETYTYDKRHLFSPANEHKHYTPGNDKVLIHYKGWNIAPFICYDLRFPVWSRSVRAETDLMIYVANWPAPRNNAWKQLLIARAIENQCYVAGVNRIGKDARGIDHYGSSRVSDFLGKTILKGHKSQSWVKQITLDKKPMDEYRQKLPFWRDADAFVIK
ncbi:MAG TPA: amidohydrolase [Flavobacteriales bacterium]|nr:amidohydrolase [Flavobacteriales bacterium]